MFLSASSSFWRIGSAKQQVGHSELLIANTKSGFSVANVFQSFISLIKFSEATLSVGRSGLHPGGTFGTSLPSNSGKVLGSDY